MYLLFTGIMICLGPWAILHQIDRSLATVSATDSLNPGFDPEERNLPSPLWCLALQAPAGVGSKTPTPTGLSADCCVFIHLHLII
jgi:hypothetical protein